MKGSESAFRISVALIVLVPSFVVLVAPTHWWVDHLFIGDAAAYTIIARNIVTGAGLTYDGLTSTNGFHPLWLLLQMPLMLGAETPMERLFLVKALAVLTTLGAALVWRRIVTHYTGSALAGLTMLAFIGASGWSLYVLYAGIETPLVLLFIGVSLLVSRRVLQQPTLGQAILLGFVMGACFLARLDSVFFLLPLALVVMPTLSRGGLPMAAAWVGSGLAVTLPYLLFNLTRFGGITPVSGIVKTNETIDLATSWTLLGGAVDRIGRLVPSGLQPLFPTLFVLVLAASLGLAVYAYSRLPLSKPFNLLVLLPIAAALHFSYYALFIRELLVPWHMYLQVIAGFVLVASLPVVLPTIPPLSSTLFSRILAWALITTLVLSTGAYAYMKQKRRSDREGSYVAVKWLTDLPSGTRAVMYDGWYVQLLAGPDYHVLDLSGLVTDRASALLAKQRDYRGLLRRHKIDYVLGFHGFVTQIDSVAVVREKEVSWNQGRRRFVLGKRAENGQ